VTPAGDNQNDPVIPARKLLSQTAKIIRDRVVAVTCGYEKATHCVNLLGSRRQIICAIANLWGPMVFYWLENCEGSEMDYRGHVEFADYTG
jgi:hypothetical protein